MNHTAEEVQDDKNGSTETGINDLTSTIENLRARLFSERSISKATRERANELASQVAELEKQLRIVSIQRKKAEKATLDLLALLQNHEIGEISDENDSDSGMKESSYRPNLDNGNSLKEEVSSLSAKWKEGSSGSEHESTLTMGRSLSWKSGNNSPRSCERRYNDPSVQKCGNFVQPTTSSRRRLSKSSRHAKRREARSLVEEMAHESTSLDAQGSGNVDDSVNNNNGLDSNPEELRKCSEDNVEKKALNNAQNAVSAEAEGQVSGSGNYVQKHTRDMEIVLQHQAHLNGHFEAEEKTQREWEEKYTRNGYPIHASELCEPGNQSDITEERDVPEERRLENAASSSCHKSKEEPINVEKGPSIVHIDSFKFSPITPTESSNKLKINEMHSRRASTSDFAFPVVNETRVLTDNNLIKSGNSNLQAETTPDTRSTEYAIVPREGPQRLGDILDALQQAKQLLEHNISRLPSEELRFSTATAETSKYANWDVDRMKLSSGLFRLPTDFQFQASDPQTVSMGSGYSPHLNHYRYHPNAPLTGENRHIFHSTYPSSSIYPDVTRRLSSEEPFTVQSPSRTSRDSTPSHPAFYNDNHDKPYRYRY